MAGYWAVAWLMLGVAGLVAFASPVGGSIPTAPSSTTALAHPSSLPAASSIPVGYSPAAIVYDPGNGWVYVANQGSGNVSVINATHVVASVPVGLQPRALTYDAANGWVYVSNGQSANLTVLNGTTVVGSVGAGYYPGDAAYDTVNERLYVTNNASGNVTEINGTTSVGSITVGSGSLAAAYDSYNGFVYVANYLSTTVSVINASLVAPSTVVSTITLNSTAGTPSPYSIVCDPTTGYAYVQVQGVQTLYVINGTKLLTTLPVGWYSRGATYDPANGYIYVPNSASNNVSIINGTRIVGSVAVGSYPYAATYDAGNGWVYVANEISGNVTILNGTRVVGSIAVGPGPAAISYDGTNGYVYVVNSGANNVSAIPGPAASAFAVVFSESGLPIGTAWNVTVGGVSRTSSTSSIRFDEPDGTYGFTVGSVPGYVSNVTSGEVTVAGAGVDVSMSFAPLPPSTYAATFVETGLPAGTAWWITLDGSTEQSSSGTIVFDEANGSHAFSVPPLLGWTASPVSGTVTIAGAPVAVDIAWSPRVTPSYPVEFRESGLDTGTGWSVTFHGATATAVGPTIQFNATNGTYLYSVPTVGGYLGNASGSVTVAGAGVTVPVTFRAIPPPPPPFVNLTFWDTGLPAATNWSVTLTASNSGLQIAAANTLTRWSDGADAVHFRVTPGGYAYSYGTDRSGYGATGGSVTITNVSPSVNVTAAFGPTTPSPTGPGGPSVLSGAAIWVGLGGLVLVAVALAIALQRGRQADRERGRHLVERIAQSDWERAEDGELRERLAR